MSNDPEPRGGWNKSGPKSGGHVFLLFRREDALFSGMDVPEQLPLDVDTMFC